MYVIHINGRVLKRDGKYKGQEREKRMRVNSVSSRGLVMDGLSPSSLVVLTHSLQ